ncbi:MAG TPA: hypothetical protein ENN63_00590 [Bacteroidetes bacterium]|nr:hypothetical protein [Bacteroidota bacterium]
MEWKVIKNLLEKYYKGSTSTEEENILKEALRQDDLPGEFLPDREVILGLEAQQQVEPPEGFEARLEKTLHKAAGSRPVIRLPGRRMIYTAASAAAVMVVLVSGYFLLRTSGMFGPTPADTFEDPQLAWEETKSTLMLVSEMLNKGTAPLENLTEWHEHTRELRYVNTLNTGMEPLSAMNTLNEVQETLKPIGKFEKVRKILQQ